MDLRPSDEQELLRDMVRRFLADRCPVTEMGRSVMPREDWRALGELGIFGATLPEESGGLGGGSPEAMVIGEELGRALAISPYSEAVLGAADLIARHGSAEQQARWVDPVLAGETLVTLAVGDVREAGGRLTGEIAFVRWGMDASATVVVSGDRGWIVDMGAAGVSRRPLRLVDGSAAANLCLDGAPGDPLDLPCGAADKMLALVQLGYVAELVGQMETLREQTGDYVAQRKQFGVPIGTFQVVQHKLARMFVRCEQSRSLLLKAAATGRDAEDFVRHVAAAKAYAAEAAQFVAEEAVQLHGGMGITDELPVGRALRRVMLLARLFGSADEARQALARIASRGFGRTERPAGAAPGHARVLELVAS